MVLGALGWIWIGLGMAWGAALGMGFLREGWLGGYDSPRRRLLRLGHIAMIALGMLGVLAWLAMPRLELTETGMAAATGGLALGIITMPAFCALAAVRQQFAALFPIPVIGLIVGVGALGAAAVRAATQGGLS